jgi:hypothetical protein
LGRGLLNFSFSSLSISYLLHESSMPPSSIMTLRNSPVYDCHLSHLTFDRCRSLQSAKEYPANPTGIRSNTIHPTFIALHGASFDLSGHNYFQGIGRLEYVSDSYSVASIHDALVAVVLYR